MASKSSGKTLADYVAIAISPVLIMALVGSLVYFLVAVLYYGEHSERLHWILFFFVFGAVLIARISMQGDIADRAGLYGIILGGLVWIALLMYVDWQHAGSLAPFGWAIDLGLIAIVWWCAHRLTWDCTMIDETVDASGAGLLEVAGLENTPVNAATESAGPPAEEENSQKPPREEAGLIGWWERYRRHREGQRRRPHAPGVWVVYFSLAALPLFGLGQSLLKPEEMERRQYAFWLMTIYVGSGLGLLLTTSFLGLRRYLRQRKLKMPVAMTGVWLMAGGMLITALLFLGAFMPRPIPEYRWLAWSELLGSPERKASGWDQKGGSAGKDKGRAAGVRKDNHEDKDGRDGQRDGEDRAANDKKDSQAVGKDDDSKKSEGETRDKEAQGDKGNTKDQRGQRDEKRDKDQGDRRNEERDPPRDGGGKPEENRQNGTKNRETDSPRKPPSTVLPELSRQLATILKWVVGIIAGVVVLFILLRAGLKFLANFTHWARRLLAALQAFWQGLWSGWGTGGKSGPEEESNAAAAEPAPFASFRDPFVHGQADRMSHFQLVRYTFEALQAWAAERGLGRQAGETPFEFAGRVGEDVPALEAGVRQLAHFYVQVAYAHESLPISCREPLRRFWRMLVDAAERPMSAGVEGSYR
jgi:hypothetical protein